MALSLMEKFKQKFIGWLMKEPEPDEFPMCDFDRLQYEIRPCDVILIEGRNRVSEVIKLITQSSWSHAALYIGRLHDIENPVLRARVQEYYDGPLDEQLLIESMLGKGTIITSLSSYRGAHIRICRPKGISRHDSQQVIGFAIGRLGMDYGIRHNLDLARLLIPWSILPRRWRSSLFQHNIGTPTKEICSSMLAEAFNSINFPILPFVRLHKEKGLELYHRNPKLYTPRDFDYSPYFEIIKYPVFELDSHAAYRHLPWSEGNPISSADEQLPEQITAETDSDVDKVIGDANESPAKDSAEKKQKKNTDGPFSNFF